VSTRDKQVILFHLDSSLGFTPGTFYIVSSVFFCFLKILFSNNLPRTIPKPFHIPGTAPYRVWRHHVASVRSVKLLGADGKDPKVVTCSNDSRTLIHPIGEGTALWYSWRPLIGAVLKGEYTLFRRMLQNQRSILWEKVHPLGWTLLHALASMGDLTAIRELFVLARDQPLGFSFDIKGQTPLDLGLKFGQLDVLDFLLAKSLKWSKHVLEFNTSSICKLIPLNLPTMPELLDSRIFEPLPFHAEHVPVRTLSADEFDAAGLKENDYFDVMSMCGAELTSLSDSEYLPLLTTTI